jgi:hypothetical protein
MPTTKTGPIWPARAITADEAGPRHGPFAGHPQRPHLPRRGRSARGQLVTKSHILGVGYRLGRTDHSDNAADRTRSRS